jgi:hypothetical protein
LQKNKEVTDKGSIRAVHKNPLNEKGRIEERPFYEQKYIGYKR